VEPSLVAIPVNLPGAVEFNQQRDLLWLLGRGVLIGVPLILLLTGYAGRLQRSCERLSRGRPVVSLVVFASACFAIIALATLPVDYWSDVYLRIVWGRPAQDSISWLGDELVELLMQITAAAVLLWIPFVLIQRAPRSWWIYTATIAWILVTVGLVSEQVVIRPLTTSYQPLPEGPLKASVTELLERCNASDTLILIGGDDNTVVGLGPTSRILMAHDSAALRTQAQFVTTVAHELKHHLSHDNWLAIGLVGALLYGGGLLVHVLGSAAIRRWGGRFGIAALSDPAALLVAAVILTIAWSFAGLPITNAVQRHVEFAADQFALEATHDNHAIASWQSQVAQATFRVSEYYTFYRVFRATHPSDADRIRFANSYKPWAHGESGRYAKVCRPP
jgi:STE24 endopeptidase